ncbi:MAG: GNAT family N-acetyltransferase, partial [Planctomycetes bacterium]|nr:GNAT family N-acetyltransferase [Planctomycetota bacterium]
TLGRAVGLVEISVNADYRRGGLALFLLNDAFRWFLRQGIACVEVQTHGTDTPALATFSKLHFRRIEQGGVWWKEV